MKTRASLFVLSMLALSACSVENGRGGTTPNFSHADAFENLEVVATPADQAREEILAAPTEFVVPIEQERFAWERTRFFLENYGGGTGAPSNAVVKVVGARRGLSSAPGPSPYTYEVFKDFSPEGYRYSVRCVTTNGDRSDAALNAGNLARFIRDGKLEVSLLVR